MTVTSTPMRGRVHRLGRDTVVRISVRLVAALLQAITLLLAARVLGPTSFGTLAVALASGAVANALSTVGASTRVLRVRAEPEGDRVAAALFWIQAGGAVLVLAGSCVVAVLLSDPWPAVVGAVVAFTDQQGEFAVARCAGTGRQTVASVLILVQRAVPLVAVLIAPAVRGPFLVALLTGFTLVGAVTVFSAYGGRVPRTAIVGAARTSGGYWSSALVSNLRQLEPVVVGSVGGAGIAGPFALAGRGSNPLTIVVASLQAVAVPEMAAARQPRDAARVFRLLLAVAVVYAALLTLAAPFVASVLLRVVGPEYAGSRVLITVVVICAGVSAISQAFQARLLAAGSPATAAWSIGGGSVVGLVLLAVLAARAPGFLWIAPLTAQLLIVVAMAVGSLDALPRRSAHR